MFMEFGMGVAEEAVGNGRALGDAEEQQAKPWEEQCLKTIVSIKDIFCR